MTDADLLAQVWRQQSIWSQAANRARDGIAVARRASLVLVVVAAVLGAATPALAAANRWLGTACAIVAGCALGLVPLARRQLSMPVIQDWARLRSVSEALKAEVYTYLAGVSPYREPDRVDAFDRRTARVLRTAEDLLPHVAGLEPAKRAVPAGRGVSGYLEQRIDPQIDGYYRRHAAGFARRLRRVKVVEIVLAAAAVVLGVVAGVLETDLAPWIAVAGTVSGAVIAHASAARYAYLNLEYLRTAQRLEQLRDRYRRNDATGPDDEDRLVHDSERVISIQNEAWMAEIVTDPPPAPPG